MYDVSLLTYDNVFFSVQSETLLPSGFTFKPDGTKLFVTSQYPLNGILEYTLSTPWDLTTLIYNGVSFDTSRIQRSPTELQFHPDGTKLFLLGLSPFDGVHEYSVPVPWDLTSIHKRKKPKNFSVALQTTSPQGFTISPDGTKMYVSASVPDPERVYQFTLSTPWNITTASYDNIFFDVSSQIVGTPIGVEFKPDGTKMYIASTTPDRVFQYTLSVAWDLSTAIYDSLQLDTSGQDSTITSLEWKPDGSKLFVMGQGNDKLYQYGV